MLWLPFDDAPEDGAENRAQGGQPGTCEGACPVLGPGVVGAAYVFESPSAISVPDTPALHVDALDDARLYSRPLSVDEIVGLARGR